MHPDLPPAGHSPPDPLEELLHALPVPTLPAAWRDSILRAALPPPPPPFLTKSFATFMSAAWSLIALLHFNTLPASPVPAGSGPPGPMPRISPDGEVLSNPWLAQIPNPSALPQP